MRRIAALRRWFSEWAETLEIVADPNLFAGIQRGLEQMERGESLGFEEVFGKPI